VAVAVVGPSIAILGARGGAIGAHIDGPSVSDEPSGPSKQRRVARASVNPGRHPGTRRRVPYPDPLLLPTTPGPPTGPDSPAGGIPTTRRRALRLRSTARSSSCRGQPGGTGVRWRATSSNWLRTDQPARAGAASGCTAASSGQPPCVSMTCGGSCGRGSGGRPPRPGPGGSALTSSPAISGLKVR
jgi:hypothetical protein